MKLNKTSYVHVKIKKLSQYLAYLTGMDLVTDLYSDFEDIRFISKLSYLTLDFKHNVVFSMSHKITKEEQAIIEELMICLDWLEVGNRYETLHK